MSDDAWDMGGAYVTGLACARRVFCALIDFIHVVLSPRVARDGAGERARGRTADQAVAHPNVASPSRELFSGLDSLVHARHDFRRA